jgi:hypothetical protein
MYQTLIDPWLLLPFFETICWMLAGIVFFTIAVEFACLLLLWYQESGPDRQRSTRVSGLENSHFLPGHQTFPWLRHHLTIGLGRGARISKPLDQA